MNLFSEVLGPISKYNKSLPFTYEARIDILEGQADEPVLEYIYSDTLCGVVEYLDKEHISPKDVRLFAVYQDREIAIDPAPLVTASQKWLKRPMLCRSLEAHYKNTLEIQYRGHREKGDCSFTDRDRKVI